ncbi:hypothetical protein QBC43DRAFT_213093 [Cladorrhinum sp. PSN259]|nr:hypothetical protein QBC43DRAFT_213093 [Cladorrhinum sp. PSN259]
MADPELETTNDDELTSAEDLIPNDYSLFPQGDKAGFHTQNDPNDIYQRETIIERKGRIHVRCEHRDIAHGYYSNDDDTPCSLIIIGFRFDPSGVARRIKEAHIKIRFSAIEKGATDPEVVKIYPEGSFVVEPTTQHETTVKGGGLNLGSAFAGVEAGAELKFEGTVERDTWDATRIRGSRDIDGRNWGAKNSVSWDLWENGTAKTGVVSTMQSCIFLKRQNLSKFRATVTITVGADTVTQMGSLFKSNPKDDDVFYNPARQPPSTDRLQKYDVDNLSLLDLTSLGQNVDVIDFVAVHGLNNTAASTWMPDPDAATNLVSRMFGDRSAHVRFSIFSYNLNVSPVDAFVFNDIKAWAIKLLEALISLRQADHRRYPIVFMGHDLGLNILTSKQLSLGSSDRIRSDSTGRDTYVRLLEQGIRSEGKDAQQLQSLGLALCRVVTRVNFRFWQAYQHMDIYHIGIWSGAEDVKEQVFQRDVTIPSWFFTSSFSHSTLPFDKDQLEGAGSRILQHVLPVTKVSPIFRAISNVARPSPPDLPSGITINFNSDAHSDMYKNWTSPSLQNLVHTIVHTEWDAEQVSQFIRATLPANAYKFIFWFRKWDNRRNTIESCLAHFLCWAEKLLLYKDPAPLAAESVDETSLWTPESLFLRVYEVLLQVSRRGDVMFWALANLTDNIKSYQWLLAKLDILKADTDISLHVMVINTDPPPTFSSSSSYTVLEVAEEWSRPIDNGPALHDNSDLEPSNGSLSQFKTPTLGSAAPSAVQQEVMDILIEMPALLPVIDVLIRLFDGYKTDGTICAILSRWILAKAANTTNEELEQTVLRLLPPSIDLVFKEVLSPIVWGPDSDKQAVWAIELLLFSFRPLTIHDIENLHAIEFPKSFPKLAISRSSPLIPKIYGLIDVVDQEVVFGHKHLRRFLMRQGDGDGVTFGSKERASSAHHRIAKACLEYLLSRIPKASNLVVNRDPVTDPVFESSLDFFSYAVKHWPDHALLAGESLANNDAELLRHFVQETSTINAWAKSYWSLDNPVIRPAAPTLSPALLLTAFGLDFIFEAPVSAQHLTPVELLAYLELAVRAGNHALSRRLMSQPTPTESFFADRAILASINSKDEDFVLEVVDWTLKTTAASIDVPMILQRAAFFGMTRVMKILFTQKAEKDWSLLLASTSVGGHFGAIDLVFSTMLEAKQPIIISSDGSEPSGSSMPALETACKYGQSQVVEFFVERHFEYLFSGSPGVILFNKLLKVATESAQARCLQILLSGAKRLEYEGYSETLLECLEDSTSRSMLRCTRVIFDHLATVVGPQERESLAHSLLITAINTGTPAVVRFLLSIVSEKLLDIGTVNEMFGSACLKVWTDDERETKLGLEARIAASNGHVEMLKFLLNLGVDMDKSLEGNCTPIAVSTIDDTITYIPLIHAYNNVRVVEALLKAGADVNWKSSRGVTALHVAMQESCWDCAREILKYSPEVDICVERVTELSCAVMAGRSDMVRMLLDAGADPLRYAAKDLEWGLLHRCVWRPWPAVMRTLLVYNMPLDEVDSDGDMPLHCISEDTTVEVVRLLVNRKADIEAVDSSKQTPLHRAVFSNNLEVARYLIKTAGANADGSGIGESPLTRACNKVSLDMVKLLVEHGADINTSSSTSIHGTPFQTICRATGDKPDKLSIARYLLQHATFDANAESSWWGANLNVACLTMDLDIISELIARGARVDNQERAGRQAIHFAAFRSVPHLVRLVEAGASLDATDRMQRTVLHVGVLSGQLDVVRYIIRHRPDFVNRADIDGWTPLLWTLLDGGRWNGGSGEQASIIRELLNCGASILVQGEGLGRTWTAYKLSQYHGLCDEIVKLVTPTNEQLNSLEESQQGEWRYNLRSEKEKRRAQKREGAYCDVCLTNIYGIYHKCEVEYNFVLCFKCYRSRNLIHSDHDFTEANQRNEYEGEAPEDAEQSPQAQEPDNHSSDSGHHSSESEPEDGVDGDENEDGDDDGESEHSGA